MTASTIARTAPEITVDGSPLPANWSAVLVGLRIELGLGLVGRATLRFVDNGYSLSGSGKFPIGATVSIATQGQASGTLITGFVTGVSLEQASSAAPELVVTVDDGAYKLSIGTKSRTFPTASYRDVITKIAGEAGLTPNVSSTGGMGAQNDYLLQTGSDIAFLQTLTERTGCVWWVDDKTLMVVPVGSDNGSVQVKLGEDLTEFSVRASGLVPSSVSVNGWDAKAMQDVSAVSTSTPTRAVSSFVNGFVGGEAGKLGAGQTTNERNPNSQGEAQDIAAALHAEWSAGAVLARGSGLVNPAIRLMTKLEVGNAGPASGSYLVSQVEHVYRGDGFYTRFVAGPVRARGLVDTLGPATPDPGFEVPGLLTAMVSNLHDPAGLGRVKVKYSGMGADIESAWARIAGLGVGNGRGSVFQPEVNDEVLVGFERGDTRHPVVLGGLYSQKNPLPGSSTITEQGKVDYRRITSRLGHVLELADGEDATAQHLLLQVAGATTKLRVGADRFDIEVPQGHPVLIKAGAAKFEIDAQGNVNIAGNNVTIKATQAVSVEGSTQVSVKADAKVSVQGGLIEVKGSGPVNIESSAPLALKGAMVAIN